MKNSIAIAGALVLLLLITMRIGVQGSPIAGIYGEDEGIPLTLLRQRRQAGSCRTNSDCNEWNPCCSKYGYCGTKDSGHCDRGTEDGGGGYVNILDNPWEIPYTAVSNKKIIIGDCVITQISNIT